MTDKTKVSYANFRCDTSGSPAPQTRNATSFSCTYTTAGARSASVSSLYYKIPKKATAAVTVNALPVPSEPKITAVPDFCGGTVKLTYTGSTNATNYELWRKPSPTTAEWGKIDEAAIVGALKTLDRGTPSASYSYQLKAIGAGGTTSSPIVTVQASAECRVTLSIKQSGSTEAAGAGAEVKYKRSASLSWTTVNPPLRPECKDTPRSGAFDDTNTTLYPSGSLPTSGNATTDPLDKTATFTITCRDLDFPPPRGATWLGSAVAKVYIYKPKVQLYISPADKPCGTQKNASIPQGQKAKLLPWL